MMAKWNLSPGAVCEVLAGKGWVGKHLPLHHACELPVVGSGMVILATVLGKDVVEFLSVSSNAFQDALQLLGECWDTAFHSPDLQRSSEPSQNWPLAKQFLLSWTWACGLWLRVRIAGYLGNVDLFQQKLENAVNVGFACLSVCSTVCKQVGEGIGMDTPETRTQAPFELALPPLALISLRLQGSSLGTVGATLHMPLGVLFLLLLLHLVYLKYL